LLFDAIQRLLGEPLHIAAMLDLGCGTGLAGATFRPHVDRLVGIDLSAAMIAAARKKNLYDRLDVGEMVQFLAQEAASAARYDLVVAADALVYVADLAPVAAAVASVLAPGSLFAFTVETHGADGVVLQPTLRYAHGAAHVRSSLSAVGFNLRRLDAASTRTEKGVSVPGLLVVAARN
jgi:predicted TPR repeat methyltransferase